MRRKSLLILSILLLVVGFASVATNLIINNTLNIGFNNTFLDDIVFIKTESEGESSISEDGKTITYDAKKISVINEETILTFWVKNKNTQYDADVTINCSLNDNSSNLADFVNVTINPSSFTLASNEFKTGEVKVKLKSVVTEEKSGTFTCELVATPLERDEAGVIIPSNLYEDEVLNGANPVIGPEMIAVTIADDGKVTYADSDKKWYDYVNKEWANAVILVDNPSKNYNVGDTIHESDIESYFVWIPRYRYKLFYKENYNQTINDISVGDGAQEIEIEFESKATQSSNGSKDGEWLTHPAFTNFDVNGMWVGKFETGFSDEKIQVKPNVYSWRNEKAKTFFLAGLNYNEVLKSHMMKNTEWGAVAYLSHSKYGINEEVRINNNSNFLTGYAANTKDANASTTANQPYNTEIGYLASTTGNITGVYDMSGGAIELVASYVNEAIGDNVFTNNEMVKYANFFDIYAKDSGVATYSNRILGDATGEMGPFYLYQDDDGVIRRHNNWYRDSAFFVEQARTWFGRGRAYSNGYLAGQFAYDIYPGSEELYLGFRLVLTPK